MKISLKRVSEMDVLKQNIKRNISFYTKEDVNELIIENKSFLLDDISEPIMDNAEIELKDNEFTQYLDRLKWKQNYDVGKILYKKLQQFQEISGDILDDSFWTYMTHIPCIRVYIIKRYFSDINEEDEESMKLVEKIERYYFGKGTVSRTGILFNWKLTNALCYKSFGDKSDELCLTAFSNIDSVKAIYERSFRKNPLIVKAFVEGIIKNDRSRIFNDSKYRSLIPTHISNIAALNCFDAYTYQELVEKITYEQGILISEYSKQNIEKV